MKKIVFWILGVGLCWNASPLLSADTPFISSSPKDIKLVSNNKEFSVHVKANPNKESGFAKAVLKNVFDKKFVREFELLNRQAPLEAILFDNGALMTFDDWPHMGVGPVVAYYDHFGRKVWSLMLADIFSEFRIGRIAGDVNSHWWRKVPNEWYYEFKHSAQESIVLVLRNEDRVRLRLMDGVVEYLPIDDLGKDPERWVKRAQTIIRQPGPKQLNSEQAILAYNKAIMADIHCLEAYEGLGKIHIEDFQYVKAIQILQEGIQQNKNAKFKRKSASLFKRSKSDEHPLVGLYYALSTAYYEFFQEDLAVEALQNALALDPDSWESSKRLAQLLLKVEKLEQADQVLAEAYQRRAPKDSSWDSGLILGRATLDIGEVYESEGHWQKAKEYYMEFVEKGFYYEPLYNHLVLVNEKLEDNAAAIEVIDHMIDRAKEELSGPFQVEKLSKLEEEKNRLTV